MPTDDDGLARLNADPTRSVMGDDQDPKLIASFLDQTLRTQGRNGAWLAERVGLSPQVFSEIRNGRRTVERDLAARIASVLEVPVPVLFDLIVRGDLRQHLASPETPPPDSNHAARYWYEDADPQKDDQPTPAADDLPTET